MVFATYIDYRYLIKLGAVQTLITLNFSTGFTILTAGAFQTVMYFWNVVLSYYRILSNNKKEGNNT